MKIERQRYWFNYAWGPHVLQRMCEYKLRADKIFDQFEQSIVFERDRKQTVHDFAKHGGIKGLNKTVLLSNGKYIFIVDEEKKRVMTLYPNNRYQQEYYDRTV